MLERAYVKTIILIIVLLFLITFGIKNSQPIQLLYYLDILTDPISLYGIVYLSVIIGLIIGMIVGVSSRFMLWRKVRSLQREAGELREKVIEEKGKKVMEGGE